ncbi:ABC transporter ATP-binding protein [Rhodovulum sp. 12E13]|uniref:ABC transporter ATP-binding protein n=1 Tax=Rhodovulum sp. 12E13 TaxID=2203891 RepID=UPI000E145AAD|nr:ABC transporter ATP-binding protein [Rhodovulum sp. 12E13]RDC69840.1 ABC transporter ATP-binding protein [Rhodovulum sp. 12E13]
MTTPRGRSLTLRDLEVTGEGGRRILYVPRLQIAAGSAVAVRGPSGAGKTTLLYALAGLVSPAAGRILWDDEDIAPLGEPARAAFRRRTVGFVFQEHLLFEELSAPGNAALAALYTAATERAAIRARAAEQLSRLGLDRSAARRSDSYSGGERQRIAVARALAADPDVILADEPTASLDRANADRLADDLVALARHEGRTLITVSHDPAVHARADRVLDIADGRLAADTAQGAPGAAHA